MNKFHLIIILKSLFLMSLFYQATSLSGQERIENENTENVVAVSVEKIVNTDKLLTGQIGEEYDITIYLKLGEVSQEHGRIYFVKGWYYYDQYKQQIPVMGLWDGEWTLYVFEEGQEEQLTWEYEDRTFWAHLDSLRSGLNYKEKFFYNPQNQSGYWTNGEKELKLSIAETDLAVYTEKEYLKIEKAEAKATYYADFKQLNIYDRDLSVVSYQKTGEGLNVLLEFNYTTRLYYSGMCGAGTEAGYILLTYDSDNCLQGLERVLTESCEQMIESEKIETSIEGRYEYKITKQEEWFGELILDEQALKWEWRR